MAERAWIEMVPAQTVAAVRVRAAPPEIPNIFRTSLDKVWALLRKQAGLRTDGHNVFIYHRHDGASGDGTIGIEFGVQVTRVFTGEGDVVCSATPAGCVATALHVGPYHRLGEAHGAVVRWCAANGHALAGVDWEIYGDWTDDPTKLETRVCYLLR